jgi:hypothetical protein
MNKQKSAYVLSHNGLGDNITMIGAVIFLLDYYDTIYFLCKKSYQKNVDLFFLNKAVITVPFNSENEYIECFNIINEAFDTSDIFIDGQCHNYCKSKITHPLLASRIPNNKDYVMPYEHISKFYYNMGLDLSIYFENFNINSSEVSKRIFDLVKSYKIVFLHTQASNRTLDLSSIIDLYKNNKEYIIISANKNVYNENDEYYTITESFVNLFIADYIDIITSAEEIHVIDSCFSCIVYPLLNTKRLSAKKCCIYER